MKLLSANELIVIMDNFNKGQIGVLPTDTIYGLHAGALDKKAIERINNLKGRGEDKPFIILISSLKDLELFNIKLTEKTSSFLEKYWPGPLSVILGNLAFRWPKNKLLNKIASQTGPLVSTSVNPSGKKPAENILEAKNYFGESVDFYVDAGELVSQPSTLIKINSEEMEVLREGSIKKEQLKY